MNVNEPSPYSSGSSAATARARQGFDASVESPDSQPALSGEYNHLPELLRSLRSLAADSPERQAKIEGLMRAYAAGSLTVDADATASAIVDDAVISRFTPR